MPGLLCPGAGIDYVQDSSVLTTETMLILKPNIAHHVAKIIAFLRDDLPSKGLTILSVISATLNVGTAETFYAEHYPKDFFPDLIALMTRGPITVVFIRGVDAIKAVRKLVGPTDPVEAKITDPESLRAKFGMTKTENSFHASDSSDSFQLELSILCPLLRRL